MIGVDRQIGMHIAVAGMHVQGHEHPSAQNLFMHGFDTLNNGSKIVAFKNFLQSRQQAPFPGNPQRMILNAVKQSWSQRRGCSIRQAECRVRRKLASA